MPARREMPLLSSFLASVLALHLFLGHLPCQALNFVEPPSFTPGITAPLAGLLELKTDAESRVTVTLNDGYRRWTRTFHEYSTNHEIPLLGFKPDRLNQISVTVTDRNRVSISGPEVLTFQTDPLPSTFPDLYVNQSDPSAMEPGYTLFMVDVYGSKSIPPYAIIVDNTGAVVWYYDAPTGFIIRQMDNGHMFMPWFTNFAEIDMLGQTVQTWTAPVLPLNLHEGLLTDHQSILYLSDAIRQVSNFPNGGLLANVLYQPVVEFPLAQTDASQVKTWSTIDSLDPRRVTYLSGFTSDGLPTAGWDTEHANAVIEDPSDDSLIISMRNQNSIIKFSRDTGQIKWILGAHDLWGSAWQKYLLTPVGSPFSWQFGQHAPVLTPWGTLMVYDNGNYRATPPAPSSPDYNNYSRAVEYQINEKTMEVRQVWSYGSATVGEWFYTGFLGSAEREPLSGNVLIDFPALSYIDGSSASPYGAGVNFAELREVTHDSVPQIVFDMTVRMDTKGIPSLLNSTVYRAHRIPDLYVHPPIPVTDLSVELSEGAATLRFSADDVRTYTIEASSDLATWEPLGTPIEDEIQSGNFEFHDLEVTDASSRFYRVLTQ